MGQTVRLAQLLMSLLSDVICKDGSPARPTLYQNMLALSSPESGDCLLSLEYHHRHLNVPRPCPVLRA